MRIAVSLTLLVVCLNFGRTAAAQEQEPGPRDAHRALQLTTAGSLILTAGLGTIAAINQPTWFSEGRCATGDPVFGEYGCRGFSTLHGLSALLSVVLYTATTTLEFAAFDWPGRDRHGAGFETLSYVHLIGMAVQPIAGLVTAVPEVFGLSRNSSLTRALRSIHVMTGYIIVGSFVVTAAIEL
jgi:hypothetical protein